jgi:phenylalanyl-tRNA synthetase beta chain
MKIPYSWLLELLPALKKDYSNPHHLEPVLAQLGLPVEEIIETAAPPPGVVFGVITSLETMAGTSLNVLLVDVGGAHDGPATVVSAASNARVGLGVAVATPGTQLAAYNTIDTDGQGTVVGIRTLQGVTSWGMLCSPKELGIFDHAAGLWELASDAAAPGTALDTLWAADTVLDIEVTPNRADVLSVLGMARDLAAYLDLLLVPPSNGMVSELDPEFPITVELDPQNHCSRFVARMVTGLTLQPAPLWIQRRLALAGMRPINNLVDASNYVMLELGQPTAAYDARDLPEQRIIVRDGLADEHVVGLNGQSYQVDGRDLVVSTPVAAQSRIIGIGGILGAQYSAISDQTSAVILEAAAWNPVRLRLSGRRLGLTTDALYHFERGVDPNLPAWAADRYVELLSDGQDQQKLQIIPGRREVGPLQPRQRIRLRPDHVNRLLGTRYDHEDIYQVLERLGCQIDVQEQALVDTLEVARDGDGFGLALLQAAPKPDGWLVYPPTYRIDLLIEEDLIEEVARILGFDALPETLPQLVMNNANRLADGAQQITRQLKEILAGLGLQETVSYSFSHLAAAELVKAPPLMQQLKNPQSSERTHLRSALYPSLLQAAQANKHSEQLAFFEVGRVFPGATLEEERLCLLLSGDFIASNWQHKGIASGFYALKGLLEALATRLGDVVMVSPFEDGVPARLHPGIAGQVHWNGQVIGEIGALHPEVAHALELRSDTVFAEVRLPLPQRGWNFADPSRQPAALRDLAIITPQRVSYATIAEAVRAAAGPFLHDITPFDVYSGAQIAAGQRSLALHLRFRAAARTLTDVEVDAAMDAIIGAVRGQQWEIRG